MGRAERRRGYLNTLVVVVFFVAGLWLFATVDDPVERARNRLCTTGQGWSCN